MQIEGMLYEFQKFVAFIDEMKQHRVRPKGLHPKRNIARKLGQWKGKELFLATFINLGCCNTNLCPFYRKDA